MATYNVSQMQQDIAIFTSEVSALKISYANQLTEALSVPDLTEEQKYYLVRNTIASMNADIATAASAMYPSGSSNDAAVKFWNDQSAYYQNAADVVSTQTPDLSVPDFSGILQASSDALNSYYIGDLPYHQQIDVNMTGLQFAKTIGTQAWRAVVTAKLTIDYIDQASDGDWDAAGGTAVQLLVGAIGAALVSGPLAPFAVGAAVYALGDEDVIGVDVWEELFKWLKGEILPIVDNIAYLFSDEFSRFMDQMLRDIDASLNEFWDSLGDDFEKIYNDMVLTWNNLFNTAKNVPPPRIDPLVLDLDGDGV